MGIVSVGDMARTFQNRLLTAGLKTDLARLSKELTTGQRDDIALSASGDFGPIANIERILGTYPARSLALSEARAVTDMAQTTLETVHSHVDHVGAGLLAQQGAQSPSSITAHSQDARARFQSVVQALNTHAAGRTLFGGAATDRAALNDADSMLAAIATAVSGETTAAGVSAAIDDWFTASGGGFETMGYLGSDQPMGPFPLEDGAGAQMQVRADDPVLREVMAGLAKAAILAEGALAGDIEEQSALLVLASESLVASNDGTTLLRSDVGTVQARLDDTGARMEAEKSALELARSELIGVDPYEVATELEAAMSQLETLYTVTARLAALTFTDYMR